jgi:two-component system sensor histidine kinase YesM
MNPIRRLARVTYTGSFRKKWILTLLAATLLPLLITLVLVLNITSSHFQDQREEALLAEAKRMQGNLEKRLESIDLVNENLSRYVTSRLSRGQLHGKQSYSDLLNYESMRDNINAMEQIYDVDRIRIFTDRLPYVQKGNRVTLFTMDDLNALSARHPQLLKLGHAYALDYLILDDQILPGKNIWGSDSVRTIAFYNNVYNTDRELVAVFMSEIIADDFLMDMHGESEEAYVQLLCDDGAVVSKSRTDSALSDLLAQAPASGYALKDGHLLYTHTLANVGWRLEIALPIGATGVRGTLAEVYLVIIILSFILSLILALGISNQTTRRLGQYLEAAKSTDYTGQSHAAHLPSQLDQLIAASRSNDEIDQLMASFSTLIRDNLQLISRMKQRDLDIEKYKFQVLQEQINPHFLYNALDTMRLCISMGQRQQALGALDALSNFYRIALSKGRDTITVGEEMRMIRCYLEIENIGYDGRLEWSIQVDSACEELPIPKFLVQPLIENSIVHGRINKDRDSLTIDVSVKMVNDIMAIRVANDGIGMGREKLEKLNLALSGGEMPGGQAGFGLLNVNQRLKLFFGSNYGLSIRGDENGTENIIRLSVNVL